MAKPAHTRVVFDGVIGSAAAPLERWSFGINFPAEAQEPGGTQVVADLVAADLATNAYDPIAAAMPADCILTGVKVSSVGADGKVRLRADASYDQGEWEGEVAGGQGLVALPLQTALAVSLVTTRAGATGKGRFFLPWPAYPLEVATKRLSVALTQELVDQVAKPFLNNLATVMTYAPQVVSSKGYMSEVIGLRIGRVPDTMRSRREDIPEGYIYSPLA